MGARPGLADQEKAVGHYAESEGLPRGMVSKVCAMMQFALRRVLKVQSGGQWERCQDGGSD